ncbi:MAG TPA: hypothetical protein VFB71_02915 [Ramlibacter sp.]|nr:hypothetical protein [Ramlibacter sp.]
MQHTIIVWNDERMLVLPCEGLPDERAEDEMSNELIGEMQQELDIEEADDPRWQILGGHQGVHLLPLGWRRPAPEEG